MGIGSNIKKIRTDRGITQRSLAEKLGITPAAVGNYENDVSFPKEDILMKMFGALDCTPNELFGLDELLSDDEHAHLNMYKALDEHGKVLVNACTEIEIERVIAEDDGAEVAVAARKGRTADGVKLKRRCGKSILDMPDYKGGRR